MTESYTQPEKSNRLYHAFGLTLRTDFKFPELEAADGHSSAKIDVNIARCDTLKRQNNSPERFFYPISVVGDFLIEHGNSILYKPLPHTENKDLRLALLGSCMAAILQQRGHIVLHGNAVSNDGISCDIHIGHSGAGKSTIAAWHYVNGDSILADDVCLIHFDKQGQPYVVPSYPQLKIWQPTADLLNINTQGLRKIRPNETKYALPVRDRFIQRPLPINRIIEIVPSVATSKELKGLEKISTLIENTYRYHFLMKMGTESNCQQKILALASKVDVVRSPRKDLVQEAISQS